VAVLLFAICLVIFLHLSTVASVFVIIACLGLADSCIYPAILGFGIDRIGKVTPAATSFMVTVGVLSIPIGTGCCSLIGENFGRPVAMYSGPVFLLTIAVLIFIVHRIPKRSRNQEAN